MAESNPALSLCDLHCDTALRWLGGCTPADGSLQVSLPCLKEAGVALQVFAIYVPATLPPNQAFFFARQAIDRFTELLESCCADLQLCRNSTEVQAAWSLGRIAAILAVENGDAIENDLKNLETLYRLGVRLMTLIHVKSNDWVISCRDSKPAFAGLSAFGAGVVEAMNDLGMIIDVSHAHDRAAERVLELSRQAVVASHSCVRRLCPVARNLPDSLIRGIAAGGGVIGVNFHPVFLDRSYRKRAGRIGKKWFAEMEKAAGQAGGDFVRQNEAWSSFSQGYRQAVGPPRVPLDRLLEHIDYIVDLAGEEAAAFGSDFDGIPDTPEGLEDCRGFTNIVAGLRASGHRPARLEKICRENFLRVFRTVCG